VVPIDQASRQRPDLFAELPAFPASPRIRVGIGGWTYVPWRGGMFYPVGLVQRRELEYASRQLTSIEVNGTYYGAQKRPPMPSGATKPRRVSCSRPRRHSGSWNRRRWPRPRTRIEDLHRWHRRTGRKSWGRWWWQFDKGRRIDGTEFEAFVESLPAQYGSRRLRHVLDVRDPAFVDSGYVATGPQARHGHRIHRLGRTSLVRRSHR
jgi:uncharacterized protein YecE (DUF72 family)